MNIFVLNCGSSSLKYKLIQMPEEKELVAGEAKRIASETAKSPWIKYTNEKGTREINAEMENHKEAFDKIIQLLKEDNYEDFDAIGHRLVHGGEKIEEDCRVDSSIFNILEEVRDLAPIHNPPVIDLIRLCDKIYPHTPQFVVTDTSFHNTIPDYAKTYAIPAWIREKYNFRKYGFHGISHKYITNEAVRYLNIDKNKFNCVSCHLGSGGASLCAVKNGKSVDNTMGFSPLKGLIMSTRTGDIDPAIILKLLKKNYGDYDQVKQILNKESGIIGLSGVSSDIRDIVKKIDTANSRSHSYRVVYDAYIWRIKKYLGSYLTLLGDVDAVIFTDTIGEEVPQVREDVCQNMDIFSLQIDPEKNKKQKQYPAILSKNNSNIDILTVETKEELQIARTTYNLIN